MGFFTEAEITHLTTERLLARVATVGRDGTPHVALVGWRLDDAREVIEVGGRNLTATKKFKDVARTGRAAIVIDDVLPPWRPRGVEIRGRAEAIEHPQPLIRIYPERIIGWVSTTLMGSAFAKPAQSHPLKVENVSRPAYFLSAMHLVVCHVYWTAQKRISSTLRRRARKVRSREARSALISGD